MDDIVPTIFLNVSREKQSFVQCRAILDTDSTKNFIVDHLAAFLHLPREGCHIPIRTLNGSYTVAKYTATATVGSRHNAYQKTLDFLVVPTITTSTPDIQINRKCLNIPSNLHLADLEFHKPAVVQMLIGSGATLAALCVGQVRLSSSKEPDLILQKTQFGWVVGGSMPVYPRAARGAKCLFIDSWDDISRFWEMEDVESTKHLSAEETSCEEHFLQNVTRDEDGRFVVALPFNQEQPKLGESYLMAFKRLASLEKRFKKDPPLEKQYRQAIQEFVDRGYVTKIQTRSSDEFFMPHQAVFKQSSLTTKIRIVFDASAASSTGISLNEALLTGPTIQDDIFSLLLRFRIHRYVLTGDIEKMYLQIRVREQDQPRLRILWREDNGTLSIYQFNRLTFGLKPASYIATRCLHRLAEEENHRYPLTSQILKRDLYVDDLLTRADSIPEVIHVQGKLTSLLREGGFNIRQCASNAVEVLQTIPDRCVNLHLQGSDDTTLKTLGVHWNSADDQIVYTVKPLSSTRVTKRTIFFEVAKIFDPLGLLNPVIVNAKLIIQELWKMKMDWDESLPIGIHTTWEIFTSGLPALNDMAFDRRALRHDPIDSELHGFCDASEKAYGACAYIRSTDNLGRTQISLLCAKSRVAPIKKTQTIPRLELCAALLLANLCANIKSAILLQFREIVLWTDSMIALHWINTSPRSLKTFVANRVSSIQSLTNKEDWRHVRTHENPADLLSRGVSPIELKNKIIWREGPRWLAEKESSWPPRPITVRSDISELRTPTCLATSVVDTNLLRRYSSYTRLQRIVAWCRRFLPGNRTKGLLTVEELWTVSETVIKLIQRTAFGQTVAPKSRMLTLNPFIGGDGLIRVGGRLQRSNLSFAQKHPIVLPKSHPVTKLLIEREHQNGLHGGVQATLATIRQRCWPIDGRNEVRRVVIECTRCARANPAPVDYIMGILPKARTAAGRPFTNTGVDYCGPFYIKEKRFRNHNKIKIYVSVFVCLATKALHLEVVSDLTTEGFLSALKRFVSRRGKCTSIFSDNRTNFVGANNELKELHELLISDRHNAKVHDHLANQGISWRFIPPQSPHFGGLWEAAVKSFKHHLRRVVGTELFTFEQFNTLLIEIEAVLNSRPLTPLSSDPHDLSPLTPAHFLIGDSLSGLPEADLSDVASNRLSTWQHIQKVKRDFWVRWQKEYIHELNVRRKWAKGGHCLGEGSIVLIRDDNAPPMQWRMGRILETHPGQDGVIRTVRLKTLGGELVRNIKKLALLPVDNDVEDEAKEDNAQGVMQPIAPI